MFTNQRLDYAYKNARIVEFDSDSKFVIMSDCHRGIGSPSDEFTKNQTTYIYALEHYLKEGFTYVEAGDGDELLEHKKLKTIFDAHHKAFEVIQEFYDNGRYLLLYGNHNIYLKYPQYVEKNYNKYYDEYLEEEFEFFKDIKPEEAVILRHKKTGQEILIVHGHQGDFSNDQIWGVTAFSIKFFWKFLHTMGAKSPSSPAKNAHKRHKIEKNFCKWIAKNKKMLICGHTHRYKYPKPTELPYFNTGCCIYPSSMTAIEIVNDEITIVRWRIIADEKGTLKVGRQFLRGTDNVSKFDLR